MVYMIDKIRIGMYEKDHLLRLTIKSKFESRTLQQLLRDESKAMVHMGKTVVGIGHLTVP